MSSPLVILAVVIAASWRAIITIALLLTIKDPQRRRP